MAPRIEGPGSRCEVRPGAPGLIRAAPEPLAPRKSRVKPQLRLPLQRPPSYRREDLVVSRANAAAVAVLDAWPAWPAGAVALVGPAGCGKTHLVNIWAERSGAARLQPGALPGQLDALRGRPVVVEAADEADGEVLFHLINMAEDCGGLLLTSRIRPTAWHASVPDLKSRLNALAVAEIEAPDDVILLGVLRKFFRERNIRPADDVFAYLVRRMERSVPVAWDLVERLDEASGGEHRPVSRALAREVLEEGPETGNLFADRLAEADSSGDKGR